MNAMISATRADRHSQWIVKRWCYGQYKGLRAYLACLCCLKRSSFMPIQRYWAVRTQAVWIHSHSSSTKKWVACNLHYIQTISQVEIPSIDKREVSKPKMSKTFSRPSEGVSRATLMISHFKREKSISLAQGVASGEVTSYDAWRQAKRNTWVCRRIWLTAPRRLTSMTSSRER